MATQTIMTSDAWPALGNPAPPMSEDPNPEWEMIAEEEGENNAVGNVVILPDIGAAEVAKNDLFKNRGRQRSATIGHAHDVVDAGAAIVASPVEGFHRTATVESVPSGGSSVGRGRHRTLRRCASTPDLVVSDNAHELIVEDESDSEDQSSAEEDAELITNEQLEDEELVDSDDLNESFEVLSDKNQEAADEAEEEEEGEEDNDFTIAGEEESATLVSAPSVGTSSWTMASSAVPAVTPTKSVWGMKKSPSFKDMLAKNIDSSSPGEWGKDKALTEANLRDSHRRHRLRVRTKPKFVVVAGEDGAKGNNGGIGGVGPGMMKHANSTGDLTKMLTAVEGGHESAGYGRGRGGSGRRVKKQLSNLMEEDEEGDFVIGRGSGGGGGGCAGGGGEVLGETDAADYYRRKEQGQRSASNKKKQRPDEAKRKEISMYKKDVQRKKQAAAASGKGGGDAAAEGGGGKKKKKNDRGFGGKKERRRL
eukprot:CAMPEP_0172538200 /NCGR_PEP_ID=MMETSP1067-20121228/9647_1 /TAXON_ID=265564 ORGANISM="Thalassiosira punctigera, Strain Tpunct2005C2" /NCGR_SAMPLE_ID=MMETSP1067 /ASSEMBLY_ACC=CAM_ASM_000444 /LENGTH=477 /DNA_ID=CAMNT_0013323655 /DNA_START=294 /DNA_END=1730 /DNA_ORIENTATION=-